jgi:single-strand DNA-binding protein
MRGFNKVILAGNLTADPELRYTPKGTAIAKVRLALNRAYKTETGELKEEVTYVDVDAWGQQAETISQYLRKGRPILLEGRLKLDQWDDKQSGQKRSALRVVLESFTFIDGSRQDGSGGAQPPAAPPPRSKPTTEPNSGNAPADVERPTAEDDDVPF